MGDALVLMIAFMLASGMYIMVRPHSMTHHQDSLSLTLTLYFPCYPHLR